VAMPHRGIFSATICAMFYGFIVPSMLTNVLEELTIFAYKRGMILKRERERERECVKRIREKERAAMAAALLPLQLLQQQYVRVESRVEWM